MWCWRDHRDVKTQEIKKCTWPLPVVMSIGSRASGEGRACAPLCVTHPIPAPLLELLECLEQVCGQAKGETQ